MSAKDSEDVGVDPAADPAAGLATVNEVHLVGRVSARAVTRLLPSGDEMAVFRVVVDRLETSPRARAHVDAIDCVVWLARVRKQAAGWGMGDIVELDGALRRRFFRAGGGRTESRTEVEVVRGRLRRRAKSA